MGGANDRVIGAERLKILAVIPGANIPSAFIFSRREVAGLVKYGHEVEVFDLRGRRSLRALARSIWAYRTHLRTFKPDVVHAHYGAMTGFFSVFGALGLVPVVVTFRGSDLNPVPKDPPAWVMASHFLSQVTAFFAAGIVCVSLELQRRLWVGRNKVAVVPTGVDIELFQPVEQAVARRALGWDHDRPVVLFAALAPGKRLDIAQEVMAIVRISIPDVEFFVVDGFKPPAEIPPIMQASDCLLFTSDFEGSPTMVQEAMACNLPVVSVEVGDVPERLAGVEPSFVTSRNRRDLAAALVTVLRKRQRSNGREFAARELATGPIVRKLERVYERVVGKRTRSLVSSNSKSPSAP